MCHFHLISSRIWYNIKKLVFSSVYAQHRHKEQNCKSEGFIKWKNTRFLPWKEGTPTFLSITMWNVCKDLTFYAFFMNYFCICIKLWFTWNKMPSYPYKIGNSIGCIYLFFILKISGVSKANQVW